jgi:hypothetical protein
MENQVLLLLLLLPAVTLNLAQQRDFQSHMQRLTAHLHPLALFFVAQMVI